MAENKPRIDFEGRNKLQDVIPLSTPYLVFVDPSSRCNAFCDFCPTGNPDLARKYRVPKLMSMAVFKQVVFQLGEFPDPIKTLRLYKDGEPLINPRIFDMIEMAKGVAWIKSVDTTTNGYRLTKKVGQWLVDSGLDKLFISVPNGYSERYASHVNDFLDRKGDCEVRIKIIGNGMSQEAMTKFHKDFEKADRTFVERLINCWPNFTAGPISEKLGIYNQPVTDVKVCPYIFYSMSVNAGGSVSACFLDWQRKHIMGHVLDDENLLTIWNSNVFRIFRILHLKGCRKELTMCHSCGQLTHGAPDDIDAYAEKIYAKIVKEGDERWLTAMAKEEKSDRV